MNLSSLNCFGLQSSVFNVQRSTFAALLLLCLSAQASDWPTHLANNRRTGVTTEQLNAAALAPAWTWTSPCPPQAAWDAESRWDAYQMVSGNKSMRSYDQAFNLCAAGDKVFLSSTADHTVTAFLAATGGIAWRYYTEAPVRLSPSHDSGRVYFGSDDGNAYCVNAADGSLVWKVNPSGSTTLVPNGWKFVNLFPVRTGVVVQGGVAYFGAGLVPWKANYLMAVNATTGVQVWKQTFANTTDGHTFEGHLLATSTSLYQPQGRLSPIQFDITNGTRTGRLPGGGGSWALVTDDGSLVHGPGFGNQSGIVSNRASHFKENNAATRAAIREFPAATALLATASNTFLAIDNKVQSLPRAGGTAVWTSDLPAASVLILGGTTVYAGGEGLVRAFDSTTGTILWSATVPGTVHVLALANGKLYASTTAGTLHAFASP